MNPREPRVPVLEQEDGRTRGQESRRTGGQEGKRIIGQGSRRNINGEHRVKWHQLGNQVVEFDENTNNTFHNKSFDYSKATNIDMDRNKAIPKDRLLIKFKC